MVTLRPFVGLVPTGDVAARSVGGERRASQRLARRAGHDRHVAWLEATTDSDPADVDAWLEDGSLAADPSPCLRLLEQTLVDGHRVLGVLGLIPLGDLVPHEGTDETAVRRRIERDRRQQVDTRPLLAVLPADPPGITGLLTTVRERAAEIDIVDDQGLRHRTWPLTDDEAEQVTEALAPYPCLLADGHHRVAAAVALGRTAVPAVVTFASHAPRLDAVWRLAAIARDGQQAAAAWVEKLPEGGTGPVEIRHGSLVRRVATRGTELPVEATQQIAASVPGVQRVTSTSNPTSVAIATRDGAVVIGSSPPTVTEVLSAVAAGRSLSPKSTAFRPKPRVGLVLHRVTDAHGPAAPATSTPVGGAQ